MLRLSLRQGDSLQIVCPYDESHLPRHCQIDLEIIKRSIKRSDDVKGFKILPKRWVVERTFGWLIQSRRLIRDHVVRIDHSEALIYLSMTKRPRQNRRLSNFQTAS